MLLAQRPNRFDPHFPTLYVSQDHGCDELILRLTGIRLPATSFVHIVAIIMTAIMIYHIRSKYTAVGRKEIVMFFWMYMVIELLAMFLDSGIIPTANVSYPVSCRVISSHDLIPNVRSGLLRFIQV
jgi:hypothetical protein